MTAQRGDAGRAEKGHFERVCSNQQRASDVIRSYFVASNGGEWNEFTELVTEALDAAEARGRAEELDEVIAWLKASGRADAEALTLLRARAENHR